MKIYTKTGDKGKTSLASGKRVDKSHELIHVFGTLDELNSLVGSLVVSLSPALQFEKNFLYELQNQIFLLGSYCASEAVEKKYIENSKSWVKFLEAEMDSMEEKLPEIKNFILPGGSEASCRAHLCRVVARRTERLVVELKSEDQDWEAVITYLNRLSDYFFVFARSLNFYFKINDTIWKPES